ncbi:hypothetical protein N8Z10_00100 [bacterium]|nr:hypothetical protein [bacterium]
MALSPQLLNFKSSGVYRLEFDKSQTSNIDVETLRLVVGSSRKGPYNTPVLIDSQEAFSDAFGSIDKGLEKKGMFFHRSCLEALSRGPILALNLGSFTDADLASSYSLSTTGSVDSVTATSDTSKAYTSYFDNDKFMTPSDTAVLNTVANDDNHLLNFVNIKQDSITIIVRQAQDVAEFDMTAEGWYGSGSVPEYLNKSDRMSDYMMDVFVFKGEFDAAAMANDPIYSAYFTAEGLDKSKLNAFANLRQVTLLAQYTGSILPGFKDLEGRNLYIETIVNAEARRTGLFCAVDEDKVIDENGTKADFVGHIIDPNEDFELLSHAAKQIVTNAHILTTVGTNIVDNSTPAASTLQINGVAASVQAAAGSDWITGIDFLDAPVSGDFANVTGISAWTQNAGSLEDFDPGTPTTIAFGAGNGVVVGDFAVSTTTATNDTLTIDTTGYGAPATLTSAFTAAIGQYMYGDITTLSTAQNAKILSVANVTAFDITIVFDNPIDATFTDPEFANFTTNVFNTYATVGTYTPAVPFTGEFTITCDSEIDTALATATTINLKHVSTSRVIAEDFSEGTGLYANGAGTSFTVTYDTAILAAAIALNPAWSFPLTIGDYIKSATTGRLARVNRIAKAIDGSDTVYTAYTNIPPVATTGFDDQIVKSFENSSDYYKTFVLGKSVISVKTITQYLNVLTGGNGLYDALVDKDIIDFRYVVDTFTSFDVNGLNDKSKLSRLAMDRQNASAILNAPTVADFKESTDPSFVDTNLVFDTRYVTTSGNQDLNPTKTYTLPSIQNGANYAFYYGPGLIVSDNGKDITVPPAAYVSNNYIDKYTSALPWSIVAGPRRGVVAGTNVRGVEYAFDKNDRDNLEPFGINPIVFQRGVGLTILGNKTAQQSTKSALSSAHVREAMIYIQDGIADILKDYVFEFNNTQTRLEIKTLADSFMESVMADGGVYAYKNVMDSTNNTNEVIDNNVGIIDTFVEPVKGLEIVVHRTTILNTGEIQSGNLG